MPSIIRVLDEHTINKIAAGEVIENSSSCVKELVENAIDAQARFIEVRIIAGGRKKIEVIDNGVGMGPDDALLALERHATSKLKKIEDMNTLDSMGFRGEALPSISSISKLTLKTSNNEQATEIVISGGKILKHQVASRTQGTTIEVESLFFNVPARKEFQKSTSNDIQKVTKVMTELALAYPNVSFRFVSDQRETFNVSAQPGLSFIESIRFRVQELYGENLDSSLIPIDLESREYKIRGFISSTETSRPNRLGQHFYINGRCVQSKLLSWALREGYSTRLAEKRFPLAFLFIEMDPSLIDVNVHPQKKEIRFRNAIELKEELSKMVNTALQTTSYKEAEAPLKEEPQDSFFASPSQPLFENPSVYDQVHKIKIMQKDPVFSKSEPKLELVPNIIGIFDVYLLVQAKSCHSALNLPMHHLDGLLLIHQKRGKERLLFEYLMKKEHKVDIQNLLLPETIDFSPSDACIIEDHLDLFNAFGISIRSMRGNTFMIDGLPAILKTTDAKNIMEEVVQDIHAFGFHRVVSAHKEQLLAKAIAKSVRLEKKIEEVNEAQTFVSKLLKSSDPMISPRGKPIIKVLDQNDLSKLLN
ncbi:MAG: DNA mismatch repair protein MutL [Chlamydiae bacterium]|nr:DNA mismatch repair protein MutL [Chlamydiota bacterium]